MRTEESDDAKKSYGTKTGVGAGVVFGTWNNPKHSMEKRKKTREGFGRGASIGTDLALANQTILNYKPCIRQDIRILQPEKNRRIVHFQ